MMYRIGTACLVAVCLGVAGCQTIAPEQVAKHLTLVTPEGAGPFPVVIMYQGTGGNSPREPRWAEWLKEKGVASALVDNAGMRSRRRNPSGSRYSEDGAIAWDLLRADGRIDTNRFALMGFSRGGGMVLKAGGHFGGERPLPDFVFAFYPGGFGSSECGSTHGESTEVHIFFGEKDDVARADSLLGACRSAAAWNDNVFYHELKSATHAYDSGVPYTFTCCSPVTTVRVEPNPDAVVLTKSIIGKALRGRW